MQNLGAVRGHVYLNSMYKVRGYRIFHSTHRSDDIRKASKMSCPAGSAFNAMPYCPLWMSIPKRQATPWNARKNAYFIEVKFKWRKRGLSSTTRQVFQVMERHGIVENVKPTEPQLLVVQRPCLFHQDIGSFKDSSLVLPFPLVRWVSFHFRCISVLRGERLFLFERPPSVAYDSDKLTPMNYGITEFD